MSVEQILARIQQAKEEAARAGLAPVELIRMAHPGAVFEVTDAAIDFPESRLDGAGRREKHPYRFAIVVQDVSHCLNPKLKTVLVIPCSASSELKLPTVDLMLTDEPAFSKAQSVAYVSLMQPILKSDLKKGRGDVRPETLVDLLRRVQSLIGVASSAHEQIPPVPEKRVESNADQPSGGAAKP